MNARPDHKDIAELAYRIWEAGGCQEGCAEENWLQAERQLLAAMGEAPSCSPTSVDESIKESFPASDPPATHLPDEPPVNAEAKWAAAAAASRKETPGSKGRSPRTRH